jgi:hypothetical protein
MVVYSLALWSIFMVHNTVFIAETDKHHLCLASNFAALSCVVVMIPIVMIAV